MPALKGRKTIVVDNGASTIKLGVLGSSERNPGYEVMMTLDL